jgi:hypothetical protein
MSETKITTNEISAAYTSNVTFTSGVAAQNTTNLTFVSGTTDTNATNISTNTTNLTFVSGVSSSGLQKSGDTMTGNLLVNTGIDFLPVVSGSSDLGSIATPFANIHADVVSGNSFIGETKVLNFILDGGGSVISSGSAGFAELPYDATPLSWRLKSNVTGTLTVDVRRTTSVEWSGTDILTSADSIAGTEIPDITSGFKNEDTALTSWSGLSAGDILDFYVPSPPGTITRATLSITLRKDS